MQTAADLLAVKRCEALKVKLEADILQAAARLRLKKREAVEAALVPVRERLDALDERL
jgi:hypothetical protein